MNGVLRAELDVGLLNNVRMATEIATGLAFLTGRRLSMPFEIPIPPAPVSSIDESKRGRPATLLDLFELPIDIVHPDEWHDMQSDRIEYVDWERVTNAVCICDGAIDLQDPQLLDFAHGRTRFLTPPDSLAAIVSINARLLSFYSFFFFARPAQLRQLHAVIRGVRPRLPYVEAGAAITASLGRYAAVHIRRSDLTIGIPAYKNVTPDDVASNLEQLLDVEERVVVCSEVPASDQLFDPLRKRFPSVSFANDIILDDHNQTFFSLPRHEDNALGLVTQQIATRASRFVGTMGSTFTGLIHRERLARDPRERFLYTADFTPPGPTFCDGEFQEIAPGAYSWNRIALNYSPDVLAWFREWPEAR